MGQEQVEASKGLLRELRITGRCARQVWNMVPRTRKLALGGAVLVMAVAGAANTGIFLSTGALVDGVGKGMAKASGQTVDTTVVWHLALFYLGLIGVAYLVRESMNVLRRYLVESASAQVDKDLCVRLVAHLMMVDLGRMSREQVGSLHGRIHRSVEGFIRLLRVSFLEFFPAIVTGCFAFAAAVSKHPLVALVMLGVAPISIGLTIWQLLSQKGIRVGLIRIREAMDGTVVEQLTGLDYVRAANTHVQEVRRVEHAAERRRAKEVKHHFQMSLFGSGKAINEGFFHLLVIAAAISLVVAGKTTVGDIFVFSGLFMSVMGPLNEIHRFIDEAHENSLRVGDMLAMLDEPADRSFYPAHPMEPRLAQDVPLFVADNLQVDYKTPDGKNRRALDGLSLTIRHGETIGVAGRSGCGKSTWLRVMMRLTHPSAGTAYLGGAPLESVSREAIGRLIGYVGQNPFVFSGTIAENIAYGLEGVSREQIEEAGRKACLHNEILEMPGGYDAHVSERGQNLSGGQRQRLALARIFLKNPPILILDEGTSALDNISERQVQRAINAARADRTVILVAHRLSTLREAGRIFVFDEGRVVETGSFDELVHRGGAFAELVHSAGGHVVAPPLPMPSLPVELPNVEVPEVLHAELLQAV
jgi:ATP-binding cassette subfamily B protein